MLSRSELMTAIDLHHQEEKRIDGYIASAFSGFQLSGVGYKGRKYCKVFGRRTWAIEVFEEGSEWKAGLYIEQQVKRHNYFWEIADGKTAETAVSRLSLRVELLQQELLSILPDCGG